MPSKATAELRKRVETLGAGDHGHQKLAELLEKCRKGQRCCLSICPLCQRLGRLWFAKTTGVMSKEEAVFVTAIPTSSPIKSGELSSVFDSSTADGARLVSRAAGEESICRVQVHISSEPMLTIVTRVGIFTGNFVFPGWIYGPAQKMLRVCLPAGRGERFDRNRVAGSLKGWQQLARRAIGSSRLTLLVAVAFSGLAGVSSGVEIGAAVEGVELEFFPMRGRSRYHGLCCFLSALERGGRRGKLTAPRMNSVMRATTKWVRVGPPQRQAEEEEEAGADFHGGAEWSKSCVVLA